MRSGARARERAAGAAAAAGGRRRRRGHGAGADLVLVPEPHHRGAAGPHAVMAGALEGAPHGELQLQGGAPLAPGDRGEVLAAVHAQGPAHDPVRASRGARQPGRPLPGLDDVRPSGEGPSQPGEEVHGAFSNRCGWRRARVPIVLLPGRRFAEGRQGDAGQDAGTVAFVPYGDPHETRWQGAELHLVDVEVPAAQQRHLAQPQDRSLLALLDQPSHPPLVQAEQQGEHLGPHRVEVVTVHRAHGEEGPERAPLAGGDRTASIPSTFPSSRGLDMIQLRGGSRPCWT